MVEGYSIRQLSQQSGHNQKRLYRIVSYWLEKTPAPDTGSLEGITNVIFDGTFIKYPKMVVALMNAADNTVMSGAYNVRESSEPELIAFFVPLKERGLSPESFTTDGNPHVIKVIGKLWPEATIQRCLVHVQRQGLSWCRVNPRRDDARVLRKIFLGVMSIATKGERDLFLRCVDTWEDIYGKDIAKAPERGRVFSDLKRARSMLMRAIPNMFHYLDDMDIPPTTNGLESYFSRLKGHYPHHRGLSPEKRHSYFEWYFKLRTR